MKLALAMALVLSAACARVADTSSGQRPPALASAGRLYEADLTVLDEPDAGPVLCVGGVMDSYPPQCEGIPLLGWDWELVEGEERSGGTAWGDFHVVGRYDAERFTVVRASDHRRGYEAGSSAEFTVPCPEPSGGWVAHDPSRVSEGDRLAAIGYANDQADHAGTWVQTVDGDPVMVVDERMILTVTFTGELERHEDRLSELWGGPLCVARHPLTLRELSEIRAELSDEQPFGLQTTWSGLDVSRNRVELGVVVADEQAERGLAGRYGEGVVKLYPALRPVS